MGKGLAEGSNEKTRAVNLARKLTGKYDALGDAKRESATRELAFKVVRLELESEDEHSPTLERLEA